ncbi:MAG: hypothetical protein J6V99_07870 [Neisseriaceae bacterium]|nr:hypothetical protein [Neisseriaceae bacterium]
MEWVKEHKIRMDCLKEKNSLLNKLIDEQIKHTNTRIILQVIVFVLCFLFIIFNEFKIG